MRKELTTHSAADDWRLGLLAKILERAAVVDVAVTVLCSPPPVEVSPEEVSEASLEEVSEEEEVSDDEEDSVEEEEDSEEDAEGEEV